MRHESFRTSDFVALARDHDVAVVIAADSTYPQIDDLTAPFVYARIMGTSSSEPAGYPGDALEVWAQRAKQWASGKTPDGVATVGKSVAAKTGRDVFLYVISGFKPLNPAAAIEMIARVR